MSTHSDSTTISTEDIATEYVEQFHALCVREGVTPEILVDPATGKGELFAELDVDSDAGCIPFRQGVHTLRNGDPGYPSEGGYCEEISLTVGSKKAGNLVDITDWLKPERLEAQMESAFERASNAADRRHYCED